MQIYPILLILLWMINQSICFFFFFALFFFSCKMLNIEILIKIPKLDLPVRWQTSLWWRTLDFYNYLVH